MMVALNPDYLLRRAEETTKVARLRLDRNPGDEAAMGAMADAVRAMWQAMNAVLLVVGISTDDEQLMTRISGDVVGKGVLGEDAVRLLLDAQSAKARAVYGADAADAGEARKLLDTANEFIELARKAVLERTPRDARIRRTEGVAGGDACVRDTRIPVWTLVQLQKLGRSEEQLLADFPGLTQADLDAVRAYHREHADEIEAALLAEARED